MARFPNRFLHLVEAPGDIDNYKLFRMEGSERLSEPFEFELTIRSQGAIPRAEAWIDASISFAFGQADNAERKVNGRCASFRHLHEKGAYVEFAIKVRPAFEALTLTRDRRIFNDQSNKQVVETVLGEHQIAFDTSKYGASITRPYIVQHDESDFALVSRLLEDEGVFYYFKYDERAAPYRHRMMIAGDASGYYDGSPFDLAFRRDHLLRGLNNVQMGYASSPAKVVTHDYNFKQPDELTPVTAQSRVGWAAKRGQVFQWGAGYKDPGAGRGRADLRVEGEESGSVGISGKGTYSSFAPGARFNVDDQRLEPWERRIVVQAVTHSAFDPYAADEGEPFYHQQFEAHPSAQPFRPARTTPRAISAGPQTAVVLDQNDGKGLGRVKVRFHWDHTGHSTCWVRVLQQWGGNEIGAQFLPRPGMEVLVDFIDGRVDNPVVVGCLYNGKNKHGFALPANLSQQGWRTGGTGGLAHHLLFEDKGGGEKIDLHSGRDFVRSADQDETAFVKRNLEVSAKGIDLAAGQSIAIHVGRSRITISDAGIWIDAPEIHLNSGGAPQTFAPTVAAPPAAPLPKTVGGPQLAAPAPPGGGQAPGANIAGPGGGQQSNVGSAQAALAEKLVKPGGTGTQADADAVAGELGKMPESALKALDDHHVKVVATRGSVTSFDPKLAGQQPRGWLPGAKIDNLPGIFDSNRNTVIIATAGDATNRYVPQTGQGHGSVNLVMHEATHAIDKHERTALSSTGADFMAAYGKDLASLPAYERQTGKAGPSEAYAESAARFFGGSHGSLVTPALDDYWRSHALGGK